MVIEELKKAYFYKDRLLRAGQVIVSGTEGGEAKEKEEGEKEEEGNKEEDLE